MVYHRIHDKVGTEVQFDLIVKSQKGLIIRSGMVTGFGEFGLVNQVFKYVQNCVSENLTALWKITWKRQRLELGRIIQKQCIKVYLGKNPVTITNGSEYNLHERFSWLWPSVPPLMASNSVYTLTLQVPHTLVGFWQLISSFPCLRAFARTTEGCFTHC